MGKRDKKMGRRERAP